MSSIRASALVAFAALALACSPSIPDDTFSCDVTADCPPGLTCREGFCRAGAATDGGSENRDDAGPGDAGSDCERDGGCSCSTGETRDCPEGSTEGECTPGMQTCVDGEWGACVGAVSATTEVCNGLDDDCDGVPDGPVAAASCAVVPRAEMRSCSAGACVVTDCSAGWSDCDTTYANGCEAELGTLAHCGACGDACGWDCASSSCNDIVSIAVGNVHSCAVRTRGDVVCWGDNTNGQLGNDSPLDSFTPVVVSGLSDVTAIAVGGSHTCALLSSGGLRCWGKGTDGQLGDFGTTSRRTAVTPSGLSSGVIAVSAGFAHTCAVLTSGQVRCWGLNTDGQLGDGTTTANRFGPTLVPALSGVSGISAGNNHTCATVAGGGVQCWGSNLNGGLGNGLSGSFRTSPVTVIGLGGAVAEVSAGGGYTCARLTVGGAQCWGANGSGQLGDGTTTTRLTPVAVTGLESGVVEIEAGSTHTCAVLSTGAARCWGNGAQVGDGANEDRTSPVDVVGLSSGVAGIRAGFLHSCVALASGGARCWGDNTDGKLGDNTVMDSLMPVVVLPPP